MTFNELKAACKETGWRLSRTATKGEFRLAPTPALLKKLGEDTTTEAWAYYTNDLFDAELSHSSAVNQGLVL